MQKHDIDPGSRMIDQAFAAGDDIARRALEIAFAGGHNLLLVGPAGSGKTGLVRALPRLLPPLGEEESREVAAIYRRIGEARFERLLPPIRIPHPESTARGLLGSERRPGELDLAHRGVLVLENLPDFRADALRALRQPLEEGVIRLARPRERRARPSHVILLATMRSCPCGRIRGAGCACSPLRFAQYRRRAVEPLGYLFDLQCEVGIVPSRSPEPAAAVKSRILGARAVARKRFGGLRVNAAMTAEDLHRFCPLDASCRALQDAAREKLGLLPGLFDRALRVARTVADLGESETVRAAHLAEALQYRSLFCP